jgi:hypothetical protein
MQSWRNIEDAAKSAKQRRPMKWVEVVRPCGRALTASFTSYQKHPETTKSYSQLSDTSRPAGSAGDTEVELSRVMDGATPRNWQNRLKTSAGLPLMAWTAHVGLLTHATRGSEHQESGCCDSRSRVQPLLVVHGTCGLSELFSHRLYFVRVRIELSVALLYYFVLWNSQS